MTGSEKESYNYNSTKNNLIRTTGTATLGQTATRRATINNIIATTRTTAWLRSDGRATTTITNNNIALIIAITTNNNNKTQPR